MSKKVNYSKELKTTKKLSGTRRITGIALSITTSNKKRAGTDADVYFDCGTVGNFFPDTPGYNDFEKGDSDTYFFKTNFSLKELRQARIVLGHNNTGRKPGWHVANVVLQVKIKGSNLLRTYKRWGEIGWLAKDERPYFTTEAELQLGTEV